MKITHVFLVLLSVLAIAGSLGCVALSHIVTPADIDLRAVEYAATAGMIDANDFGGYGNLYKAMLLETAVGNAHEWNQVQMLQQIDIDNLEYAQIAKVTANNRRISAQREEQLFGEKGLLTLGLSMGGFGAIGGLVGMMRKRPGDVSPQELKQAIGGTEAKLTDKELQFAELVKGIQNFIDLDKTFPETRSGLKTELAKTQSAETKKAVAAVKAEA